jgi:hypothetical protein
VARVSYKRSKAAKRADQLRWKRHRPQQYLLYTARCRAQQMGLEFTLSANDIVIPTHCPVLGIPLEIGGAGRFNPRAPSLDRIDNSKPYTPDNVMIISWRANRLKADATADELVRMGEFYASRRA